MTDSKSKKFYIGAIKVIAAIMILAGIVIYYTFAQYFIDEFQSKFAGITLCAAAYFFYVALTYEFSATLIANLKSEDSFKKAKAWKGLAVTSLLVSFLTLLVCLPYSIISFILYRHYRTNDCKCEMCGSKMNRIDEKHDNDYLTPIQSAEENAHTVDYDVWLCPKCNAKKVMAYPRRSTSIPASSMAGAFTRCPSCGGFTLMLSKVIDTDVKENRGTSYFKCHYCGKIYSRSFKKRGDSYVWMENFVDITPPEHIASAPGREVGKGV